MRIALAHQPSPERPLAGRLVRHVAARPRTPRFPSSPHGPPVWSSSARPPSSGHPRRAARPLRGRAIPGAVVAPAAGPRRPRGPARSRPARAPGCPRSSAGCIGVARSPRADPRPPRGATVSAPRGSPGVGRPYRFVPPPDRPSGGTDGGAPFAKHNASRCRRMSGGVAESPAGPLGSDRRAYDAFFSAAACRPAIRPITRQLARISTTRRDDDARTLPTARSLVNPVGGFELNVRTCGAPKRGPSVTCRRVLRAVSEAPSRTRRRPDHAPLPLTVVIMAPDTRLVGGGASDGAGSQRMSRA